MAASDIGGVGAERAAFRHLARSLQLRHRTLRNRITFGAHTANMSEGGLPGRRHLGTGTAWHLAERGHCVTIISSWPLIDYWIQRTAGDWELRARLARLGVEWQTEAVVTAWDDEGAHVRSYLDGVERVLPADTLVLATTNIVETTTADELAAAGFAAPVHLVGDAVAARLAVHAIYEGRVAGMRV